MGYRSSPDLSRLVHGSMAIDGRCPVLKESLSGVERGWRNKNGMNEQFSLQL
jgi:hypothetical protein